MSTPHTCPKCGAQLPADAPEGLCPACLMIGGLPSDAATLKMTPSQKPGGSQPPATPTPEELAPYFPQLEILDLLGRGGMGMVYKARQKNLNRLVALKILPVEPDADEHFAERFQREAQALAKLNHPNIVSVFDFGEARKHDTPVVSSEPNDGRSAVDPGPGLFFFLMEFVDGANLRTLIRGGEMKPEAALALIPAFCDALQYAHDEGVVHRDIKPENVLVDKKGRVKIADFGLAKLLGHDTTDHALTRTGMYLGTPRYMAPEQMDKPETVDHRADIYSLGVVFYEMLTGEVPMGRFEPPSKKVQIDVKFDEIVLHAMERDVERRYQHASEVKTAVENVTSKPRVAAVHATPPPVAPPALVPAASERGSFVAFLRLLLWLVLVICAAVFLVFDTTPTAADRAAFLHSTVHIGAVQPWLHYGEEPYNHVRFSVSFLSLSAGAGLCAVIVALALFSTRRRSAPDIRREVRRAAIGLLVSGVAGAVMTFAFTMMLINEGQWDKRLTGCIVGVILNVTFAVLAVLVFRGALKMLHLEDYTASRRAALCSIFSLNILSLPIGIWVLVRLSRPEVKALFLEKSSELASETKSAAEKVIQKSARRFLDLRFWLWPLTSALLIAAAIYVPRPGELSEPKDVQEIFQPMVLVTPEGGSYRFVGYLDGEWKTFKPVYVVNRKPVVRQEVTRTFGWDAQNVASLGIYHRTGNWKYELNAMLFGSIADNTHPLMIPDDEIKSKLLPLVFTELEQRQDGRGKLLIEIIQYGRSVESVVCWQNLVVLLAWISVPLAMLALFLMLWRTIAGKIMLSLLAVAAMIAFFLFAPRNNTGLKAARELVSPVPPLGTVTSGIGAQFTVPAGQVVIFELVTRSNNATVPLPNLAAYAMAPSDNPMSGTFLWTREPDPNAANPRRHPWRIEVVTEGGGKASTGGLLLPETLDAKVGSMSLGLGLEPNREDIHWLKGDEKDLPAAGVVGLRIRTLAHGIKSGMPGSKGGSGAASTEWMSREMRMQLEQKLRDIGVPFEADAKPEELVKKLEKIVSEIGK